MNETDSSRIERRQFCKQLVVVGALTAVSTAARETLAEERKSIKTEGLLTPVYDEIVCRWTPENPRHDHPQIFPLSDNRLMLAWSEHYATRPSMLTRQPTTKKGEAGDSVPCRISARISTDGCRTWSDRFVVQDNLWHHNVKNCNFIRSPSGEILLFVSGWDSASQRNLFLKRSTDECETWGKMVQISKPGFICTNGSRILRLSSGRIILPSHSGMKDGVLGAPPGPGVPLHSFVYYSDDEFKTWQQSDDTMTAPGRGAHEPSIVELKDGRLLCILRTTTGRLYQSFSEDQGVHWTTPTATDFPAPDSQPLISKIPSTGDLILVWDNVESHSDWPRTPLSVAISKDDGKTWGNYHDIDARADYDAAYPSIFFNGDEVLIAYYTRPTSWSRDSEITLKIFNTKQFYG